MGPQFYVVIRATGKGLGICRERAVPSFLSYFKTLSIGPAPGIEPATDLALQSSALPPELILRGVSLAWDVC